MKKNNEIDDKIKKYIDSSESDKEKNQYEKNNEIDNKIKKYIDSSKSNKEKNQAENKEEEALVGELIDISEQNNTKNNENKNKNSNENENENENFLNKFFEFIVLFFICLYFRTLLT